MTRKLCAALLLVALTGCAQASSSSTHTPGAQPTSLEASPVTASPTTTPTPDVPAVGAMVVSPLEVQTAQAAGLGVYVTADGRQIVIDPKAPAPQFIVDEARASGFGAAALPDSAATNAAAEVLNGVTERAAAAGKKLVFIFQSGTYGDWDDDDLKETHYGASIFFGELRTGPLGKPATPAEARAKIQERIDAQPDPSVYEIVDLTIP